MPWDKNNKTDLLEELGQLHHVLSCQWVFIDFGRDVVIAITKAIDRHCSKRAAHA